MKPASPDHSIESLLEHSDWIRAVAKSLVRDAATAEDLAQDVWLKTLHQPPPNDRPARAWLTNVVKHASQQFIRGRDRRLYREHQSAKREALPSNEDLEERIALQQWVVESVMSLEEPYKRTVLLRFFEGLPPSKIAVEMDVPLETVKSRLQRAVERLRRKMGSERGPNGELGVMALLPLVGPNPWSVGSGVGLAIMSKQGLGIVAIVLACLTAALFFSDLGADDRPGLDSEESTGLTGGLEVVEARDAAAGVTHFEIPAEAAAESRTVARPEEEFVVFRTVAGEPSEPVPRARLWIVTFMEIRDGLVGGGRGESFDIEAAAMEVGREFRTNEDGELRVPKSLATGYAIARNRDLFGCSGIQQDPAGVFELRLELDRSLTIQTVTEDGQPVSGIPVGIAVSSQGERSDMDWWAHTLGERGQVTLHHVQYNMQQHLAASKVWTVTLATPTPNPPRLLLDPRELPTEALQLVVEVGGRVIVRVEDDEGEHPSDTWINLRELRSDKDSVGRDDRPMRHSRYSRDGVAVFENVAADIDLHLDSTIRGFRRVQREFRGPGVSEEKVIDLSFVERFPVIRAHVLDGDGALLSKKAIEVRAYTTEDIENGSSSQDTDSDGKLELSVRTRTQGDALKRFELRTDPNDSGESLTAIVHVGAPTENGVYDLGEVRMERTKPVVSGRVLDSRGEPIYWAGIWVMRMNDTGDQSLAPYEWVDEWQTQTSEDGSFRLVGDQGPGDYQLRVKKDGYLESETFAIQPGDHGLEIVLEQEGALEGSLLLPQDIPANWLRISAQTKPGVWSDPVRPHPDGEFFLRELPPGATVVKVYVPSWKQPLLEIPNVWVESGQERSDPRIKKLDLKTSIHRIDFRVTDSSAVPIPLGYVTFRSPDDEESHVAFQEGQASLIAPSLTLDIEVIAPNYRPITVESVRDEQTITLETGIPINVTLPEEIDLPPSPFTLSLQLTHADEEWSDGELLHADDGVVLDSWRPGCQGVEARFDESRVIQVAVGGPGTWSLHWTVSGERWTCPLRPQKGSPLEIEVLEASSVQSFELAPDAAFMAERLSTMK